LTASNREASIRKTLTYEGGYTNDPRDPGGATNWGITIHDARLYWKTDATHADVRSMPISVAIDIYRQKYWAKIGADDRPTGPDFAEFDLGVNSGVGRVFSWRPSWEHLAPVAAVKACCAKRLSFLHALRTWSAFGKGWGRRVADVEATGVRMALGAQGKPIEPPLRKEASNAAKKSIGHSTGAATASTGAAGSVPDVSHIWVQGDLTTKVGLVALGVGAVLVIGAFVWHAVHNNHRANAYKAQASGK
jgi:lysozyme family protein